MYRQSEKNLLSSNISPACPHNMVNFGPLAAEIVLLVWGTPGNFNGFRVLAALLHGTLVVGVSQTAAFNRGRHLYLAGRPSRWALADTSSNICYARCMLRTRETRPQSFGYRMPMTLSPEVECEPRHFPNPHVFCICDVLKCHQTSF